MAQEIDILKRCTFADSFSLGGEVVLVAIKSGYYKGKFDVVVLDHDSGQTYDSDGSFYCGTGHAAIYAACDRPVSKATAKKRFSKVVKGMKSDDFRGELEFIEYDYDFD